MKCLVTLLLLICVSSANAAYYTSAEDFHREVCALQPYEGEDPWRITHLYNCATREFFIPYQLWSGASWDGDKQAPCMHEVDRSSRLDMPSDKYSSGELVVKGPIMWTDPGTGEEIEVWSRSLVDYNSTKYYACHERGIGTIRNMKKPHMNYLKGLCHAPGGYGWKIGEKRTCIKTTLEIIEVELDEQNRLKYLVLNYWFRDKLSYRYWYEPERGAAKIMSLKRKRK